MRRGISRLSLSLQLLDQVCHLNFAYPGSRLLRVGGVAACFDVVLRRRIDVAAAERRRADVSQTALADAVGIESQPGAMHRGRTLRVDRIRSVAADLSGSFGRG